MGPDPHILKPGTYFCRLAIPGKPPACARSSDSHTGRALAYKAEESEAQGLSQGTCQVEPSLTRAESCLPGGKMVYVPFPGTPVLDLQAGSSDQVQGRLQRPKGHDLLGPFSSTLAAQDPR